MNFVDERDVFFYLLSNFLDWNSLDLLSTLNSGIPTLDYVDDLSMCLPERYREIGEDCVQFLMSLLPHLSRGLDNTDIVAIREFVSDLHSASQQYSDYSYVFPFSTTSGVPSYAFTILMRMDCDLFLPDRYGRLVTDILDYISPDQWTMLIGRRYDLTNPVAMCDILDKMALSIYVSRDEIEEKSTLLFNRDVFSEALFRSTQVDTDDIMRPGLALSLLTEKLWTLEFQEKYPNTLGLLLIMNNAVIRIYPDESSQGTDVELAFRNYFIERNLKHCYRGIQASPLTEATSWEILLDNTYRYELLHSVNIMKTVEHITQTHLITPSNGILLSSRFVEWILQTRCSKEAVLEHIRVTALNAVTELSIEDSWDLFVFVGKAIELETMPTDKDQALRILMDTALQWSLSLTSALSWADILDTARDFGIISFPADKESLISRLRLNLG